MSSPSDSITDIGKIKNKKQNKKKDMLTNFDFLDESGLNRKRERAQSVEPTHAEDLTEQVRIKKIQGLNINCFRLKKYRISLHLKKRKNNKQVARN
jgi:hypothetical protein